MSAQESRIKEIALQTRLHPEYVRRLIRGFNIEGLRLFEERPGRGRNEEFSDEIKAEIAEIAQCPPSLLRQPYSLWLLEKLQTYLIKTKVVSKISIETLQSSSKNRL